jgi:serine/threonine-protein kinase
VAEQLPGFEDYEIQERLGSGGMGEVYRAVYRKNGRAVALKVEGVRAHEDPEWRLRERFLREARILQGLHHENLPEFYAAGQLPDGRMYIAIELLVGRPLTVFSGAPLETLVPLFIQCARALQTIAEAGVVHRDVSPENFFVVEVGGHSVAKLIDFGLSKDASSFTEGLTRVGTFLGKPQYSSPEQAGQVSGVKEINWKSDLYSFGLSMHHLITGQVLFPGRTPMDQLQAREKDLPKESFKKIQPARLRKLLARMLKRNPAERPDSFDEIVVELLRVQAGLSAELASQMDRSARIRKARDKKTKVRSSKVALEETPTVRLPEGSGGSTEPSRTASPLSRIVPMVLALVIAVAAGIWILRGFSGRRSAVPVPVRTAPATPLPLPASAGSASASSLVPSPAPVEPASSSSPPAPAPVSSATAVSAAPAPAAPEAPQKPPAEAQPPPKAPLPRKAKRVPEQPPPPPVAIGDAAAAPAPPPSTPAPAPAPPRVARGELVGPGPGVTEPELAGEIRVKYPPAARGLRLSGEVVVLVEVDENGRVLEGRVVRGTTLDSVNQAVLDGIRETPFSPPTKDGVPVKMWTTVRFRINP